MENNLNIKINAEVNSALNNINKVNKAVAGFAEEVKSKFNMNNALQGINLASNAIQQAFGVLSDFYSAAAESEQATIRFNLAMTQNGIVSENTRQYLSGLATQMQQLTNIEDEQVMEAQKYAMTMGVTASEMDKVIEGAIGLSNTYGLNLTDSVKFVTLGMDGQFEALNRAVPALKMVGTEAEKTAQFNKILADGFKTAQEQANAGFGRALVELGDIKEELGGMLVQWLKIMDGMDVSISSVWEFVKMGLAQVVNAFIMAKDNLCFPFIVMGRVAASVIQGVRESFRLLFDGEFKAAANTIKDVYVRNAQIVAEEATKVADGVKRANDIWEQSVKTLAEKNLNVTLDAEQKATDAKKKRIKEVSDEEKKAATERQVAAERQKATEQKLQDELMLLQISGERQKEQMILANSTRDLLAMAKSKTEIETIIELHRVKLQAINDKYDKIDADRVKSEAQKQKIELEKAEGLKLLVLAKGAEERELAQVEIDKRLELLADETGAKKLEIEAKYQMKIAEIKDKYRQKEYDAIAKIKEMGQPSTAGWLAEVKQYEARLKQLDDIKKEMEKNGAWDVKKEAEYAKAKKQINEDFFQTKKNLEFAGAQASIAAAMGVTSQLAGQNLALFRVNQALGIANATMDTYAGATKAYAAYPPPFGAIAAATVVAAGLANVGMIAAQTFEPVEDFISIPGKPLLKARPDDIVIGGTNLLGNNSSGSDPILKAIQNQTKVLQGKTMSAILNLGDRLVYQQNLKGQKAVNQRKVY